LQHPEDEFDAERIDAVLLEVLDRRSGEVELDGPVLGEGVEIDIGALVAVEPVELDEDVLVGRGRASSLLASSASAAT
jgi:hypothetical protein